MSDNSSHEESIRKEFEAREAQASTVTEEENKVADLGKVKMYSKAEDEEIQRIKDTVGYIEMIMENLPSRGRFYRADMKIKIKAASVKEIRDFSTLDESSLLDVDEKINSILISCCRVDYTGARGSYKDILEEDRLYVVLSIRELTFKHGENKLMMQSNENGSCGDGKCELENKKELRTNNLQFHEEDEILAKYYDPEQRCYVVPTKSSGTLYLAPPTIGVMRVITDYIREKEQKREEWDKSFLQTFPYMRREWRGLDAKEVFRSAVDYQGWSATKYQTVYRLVEKARVGIKPEFVHSCSRCGKTATVPLSFPGGVKNLFVISDISDELL